MPIRKNIKITVDPEEVMQAISFGRRDASWMRDGALEAVRRAQELWEPTLIYAWVRIVGIASEKVAVTAAENGKKTTLHIGPHAGLLEKAEMAFAAVNTIGPKLDEAVRELNQKGESLQGFLLDSVGVVALSKVGDAAGRMAEEEAACRGWGVGARLGPGSLAGWNVEDQRALCSLLELESAGVSLSDSGLIIPFKSASGLIGIGPGFKASRVGSICKYCMLKENCWRRRKKPDEKE